MENRNSTNNEFIKNLKSKIEEQKIDEKNMFSGEDLEVLKKLQSIIGTPGETITGEQNKISQDTLASISKEIDIVMSRYLEIVAHDIPCVLEGRTFNSTGYLTEFKRNYQIGDASDNGTKLCALSVQNIEMIKSIVAVALQNPTNKKALKEMPLCEKHFNLSVNNSENERAKKLKNIIESKTKDIERLSK